MTLEFTYVCDSWPLYLGQPKRGVFQALSRDKKIKKKKKTEEKNLVFPEPAYDLLYH